MATPPDRTPMAGGFLLTIGILTGAMAGAVRGQATIGLLIGLGVGIVLTAMVWLLDRRRR